MNFIQETFNFFIEAQKILKKKRPPQYEMARKFILDLNQKLLKTKQSKDPQKLVNRYIKYYSLAIKKQDERIKLAVENKRNTTNLKWKKQLYRKALDDFKLLKNLKRKK